MALRLVAARPSDLRAARAAGQRAAYVRRLEYGPDREPHVVESGEFDVLATDILDLADQLGA